MYLWHLALPEHMANTAPSSTAVLVPALRCVPVIVMLVPPDFGPRLGPYLSTWQALPPSSNVVLVPALRCVPVIVMLVPLDFGPRLGPYLSTWQALPPSSTVVLVPALRCVPVIVMLVPPDFGPLFGESPCTSGFYNKHIKLIGLSLKLNYLFCLSNTIDWMKN